MNRRAARLLPFVALFACTAEPAPVTDGGPFLDASVCLTDAECDDGLFCSGEELCVGSRCVTFREACDPGRVCDEAMDRCLSVCGVEADGDRDGSDAAECGGSDCDDGNAERNPGAAEVCDAADLDEDCDPETFGVRDLDLDGYPDIRCCNGASCGTDCDDSRSGVHPAAPEVCNGTDDDCDGDVDEGVVPDWLVDLDGDGFGSDTSGARVRACERPAGHADLEGDCDDTRAAIHPGALERCDAEGLDEDCNGRPDDVPGGCDCTEGLSRGCSAGGRCAGATQACVGGRWSACSIEPVPETCDGTDEDCNGTIDDLLRTTCYADADGDGRARGDAAATQQCRDGSRPDGCPPGFTARVPLGLSERDCNDADAAVAVAVACYADADGDGYGTGALAEQCVSGASCPGGYAPRAGDCCDLDGRAHPGVTTSYPTERSGCGGWDFDCDGIVTRDWEGYTDACWSRSTLDECLTMTVPGWAEATEPGCGNTGNFVTRCSWSLSCQSYMQGDRVQGCR